MRRQCLQEGKYVRRQCLRVGASQVLSLLVEVGVLRLG